MPNKSEVYSKEIDKEMQWKFFVILAMNIEEKKLWVVGEARIVDIRGITPRSLRYHSWGLIASYSPQIKALKIHRKLNSMKLLALHDFI